MFTLFELTVYAIVALACAASLAVLRHWTWQRILQKLPGPSNPSLLWGHWYHMFNPYAFSFYEELFNTYGAVARVNGFLGDTQVVISDPKACNNIFIKDQVIFEETESFLVSNMQAFGPTLVATLGAHHRKQRKSLNPVFNINHMRHMMPTFYRVTRKLHASLESIVSDSPQEINIAYWTSKFALELIGQAGFGYSFGTFENRNDGYCEAIKQWVPTMSTFMVSRNLFPYAYKIFHPKILKFLGRILPWPELHNLMNVSETMNAGARRIYQTKKMLLESGDVTVEQVGDGKDIISLLMRASMAESEDNRPSEEELLAHTTFLVFAATDTTSSALSRILHLLALHPDIQNRLRKELKEACENNDELPYDQLVSLPFLEAVCRETLRLYPPSPGVMRTAQSDAVLPLSSPIHDVDGRKVHEIFIPKNTNVYVQIYQLNRDPSIWGPDAAEWKPERWLAPLPDSVAKANIQGIYAHTMTFIGGPRSCIGFKFAQLEMKVALSQIIPAFKFAPTEADIVWRFGPIVSPTIKESLGSFHPNLPIVVSRASL